MGKRSTSRTGGSTARTYLLLGGIVAFLFLVPYTFPVIQFLLDLDHLPPSKSSPDPVRPFTNEAELSGLRFTHDRGESGQFHIAETLGAGVGVIDFDRDNNLDVYCVQGGALLGEPARPDVTDKLFRNDDGRFIDVTEEAGITNAHYGMGVAVGDYDDDGWPDLFVTSWGPDVLYRNRGNGTFEDVTAKAGLTDDGFSTSAAWLDIENDGDLDLYVCHYVVSKDVQSAPWCGRKGENLRFTCHPGAFPAEPDRLFRNNGDGTFEDISEAAGIHSVVAGRGLGVVGSDIDRDGDLDLYVANDTTENFFFENRGDGTFEDVGALVGVAYNMLGQAEAGMGVDAADVDGDGRTDLFVTNLSGETNTLYSQEPGGLFMDRTRNRGLAEASVQYVGFGTRFFDADNDGDLDLVVANGHVMANIADVQPMYSFRQPDLFFENDGRGFFTSKSAWAGGVEGNDVGRGVVTADLDDDGDLDLLISNNGGALRVLMNRAVIPSRKEAEPGPAPSGSGHWIGFELVTGPGARAAIGARVELVVGERAVTGELRAGSSYLSSQDPRVHIGLGAASRIESGRVIWPGGRSTSIADLAVDIYHRIQQPD
ncbi:MAG: CRTAC1 family protein [Planctomycetota bacterium]